MLIQVFSEYLKLAQAGKVNFLACPMHPLETAVFPLYHNLDKKDRIVLTCHACDFKDIPGQAMYENIRLIVSKYNEPEKMEP